MFENGEEEDMGAEEINRYIAANQSEVIEKAVDTTPLCGGLVRVDFHLERYGIDSTALLVNVDPSALTVMRTDLPYFMRVRQINDGREGLGTEIWACNPGALKTEKAESWRVERVRLKGGEGQDEPTAETVYGTEEGEDGEAVALTLGDAGLDPDNLYRFYNKTAERPLVLGDAMWSLVMLVASSDIAMQRMEARSPKPSTIRVAEQWPQMVKAATRRNKTKGIRLSNRKGEEVLRISAIESFLDLKPSGRKTLLKLNEVATKLSKDGEYRHDGETVCRVVLSVEEISKLYGITEESARKRLRRDFRSIANQSISVKKGKNWATVPVAGGAFGIRGDNAFFTISPDFMRVMLGPTKAQLDLPPEIYGTNDTNFPAATQIGFKLYNHDNINYGKPNQDRMKLTTLLDAATELPKAGTVNRCETEKIMRPFEATMDHLVDKDVLKAWDYCHENGEPLTDEEYAAIQTEHDLGKPTPWSLAEGLLVTWELGRRYPRHEEARQAARDKHRAAALEAKAKREMEAEARERRIRGKVETMEAKERHAAEKKADT